MPFSVCASVCTFFPLFLPLSPSTLVVVGITEETLSHKSPSDQLNGLLLHDAWSDAVEMKREERDSVQRVDMSGMHPHTWIDHLAIANGTLLWVSLDHCMHVTCCESHWVLEWITCTHQLSLPHDDSSFLFFLSLFFFFFLSLCPADRDQRLAIRLFIRSLLLSFPLSRLLCDSSSPFDSFLIVLSSPLTFAPKRERARDTIHCHYHCHCTGGQVFLSPLYTRALTDDWVTYSLMRQNTRKKYKLFC